MHLLNWFCSAPRYGIAVLTLLVTGASGCTSNEESAPTTTPTFSGTYDIGTTGRIKFEDDKYSLTDGVRVSTGTFRVDGDTLVLTDIRKRSVGWKISDASSSSAPPSNISAASQKNMHALTADGAVPAASGDCAKENLLCAATALLQSIFSRGSFGCDTTAKSPNTEAPASPEPAAHATRLRPAEAPEAAPPDNAISHEGDFNALLGGCNPLNRSGSTDGGGSPGDVPFARTSNLDATERVDQLVAQASLYSSTPIIGMRFNDAAKPDIPLDHVCSSTVVEISGAKRVATANHCRTGSGNHMKNFRVYFNNHVDPSVVTRWAQARDTDTMYLELDFIPDSVAAFSLAPEPRAGQVDASYSGVGANANKNERPNVNTWLTTYSGTLTLNNSDEYRFNAAAISGDSGAGLIVNGRLVGTLHGSNSFFGYTTVSAALPRDTAGLRWHRVTDE